MAPTLRVETALLTLKDVFLLQPEIRLGGFEAARLCELDDELCAVLLAALHEARFLARDADGFYRLAFRDVHDA